MERQEKIRKGYKRGAVKYDDLLGMKKWWARLGIKLIWGFGDTAYVPRLLEWIPDEFSGSLLDVPVGTGLFTAAKYAQMRRACITCLDYSADMMAIAEQRFAGAVIANVRFIQGDVGALPFEDAAFDSVLSMNGFHAFPDKEAAFRETHRVLKQGGWFVGCFYVRGNVKRTDFFINRFYVPKGYFTPPFLTQFELDAKLRSLYTEVQLCNMGAITYFCCMK